MTHVPVRFADPVGPESGELLVLGHSLGTSAELWREASGLLQSTYRVLEWELPGHGMAPPARQGYRVEDLSDLLVAHVGALGMDVFHYAGVSVTACVGLDLALRHASHVMTTTVITSGARLDDPSSMRARAAAVRDGGLEPLVEPSRGRWFAPTTNRETAERMLGILRTTDAESYALAAEALAAFDASDAALAEVDVPLLAVAGELDESVPPARSIELAARVRRGESLTIPRSAHCLVAEQPRLVAEGIAGFIEARRGR